MVKDNKQIEQSLLSLYSVLLGILNVFHEPWFDEAQAWLIARDASLGEILFVRPHYEGHPPLWHLILTIPAKLGLPYEPSIKVIQFVFAVAVAYLILFRSPFPRLFRCVLPFSYFFLFQYGVIARPYAMLSLSMFITAMFWQERNDKPWRLSGSMMIMCASSAYGIILAGGMAAVWTVENLYYEKKKFLKKKRRLAALSFLLLFALLLIVEIMPAADAYAICVRQFTKPSPVFMQLLWFWLVIPAELYFTSLSGYDSIITFAPTLFEGIYTSVFSVLLWILLLIITARQKKLPLLLIPYALLSIVGSGVYFFTHHYGILLVFFLSILWICLDEVKIEHVPFFFFSPDRIKNQHVAFGIKMLSKGFLGAILLVNLFWSSVSFYHEIVLEYSPGRSLAAYIRNNHLEEKRWFGAWTIFMKPSDDQTETASDVLFDRERIVREDVNHSVRNAIPVNPYLRNNLLCNAETSYAPHLMSTNAEAERTIEFWSKEEEPDIILSDIYEFSYIADRLDLQKHYYPLTVCKAGMCWKAEPISPVPFQIFVESALYQELKE